VNSHQFFVERGVGKNFSFLQSTHLKPSVLQGTAMASLVHMQRILSNRQLHFPSVEKAIEWSVRGGGALRNVDSARVSVPSTLRYQEDKHWSISPFLLYTVPQFFVMTISLVFFATLSVSF
jgi:hypothetical protein